MTGSDDYSNTRPISVAELLARNGTIGAPPVGGRRRRRRGNADSVTVAELTGEIPIVRPEDFSPAEPVTEQVEEPTAEPDAAETDVADVDVTEAVSANGVVDHVEPDAEMDVEPDAEMDVEPEVVEGEPEADEADAEVPESAVEDVVEDHGEDAVEVAEPEVAEPEVAAEPEAQAAAEPQPDTDDDYADAVAEYTAHLEQRDTDHDPVGFLSPRRFGFGRLSRKESPAVDAELMSPDPVGDAGATDVSDPEVDGEAPEIEDLDTEAALAEASTVAEPERATVTDDDTATAVDAEADTEEDTEEDELPSYLRSTQEPLFGGQTVADDLARRGNTASSESLDDLEDPDQEDAEPREMSPFVRGLWIVGQSVIAVVFGAGLFVAFDQLWKWNNIVALVLSVLVILGLVVGVRVVRKTEDIGSTLIAVAVGALVTLGPLALLQSG